MIMLITVMISITMINDYNYTAITTNPTTTTSTSATSTTSTTTTTTATSTTTTTNATTNATDSQREEYIAQHDYQPSSRFEEIEKLPKNANSTIMISYNKKYYIFFKSA